MTDPNKIAAIISGLSRAARLTICDGEGDEWYARNDVAADQLVRLCLARSPFIHDRRALVPTALGILVRAELMKEAGE